MTECKHFKNYQAIHPPTCGCDKCAHMWLLSQWVGDGKAVTVQAALLFEEGLRAALKFRRTSPAQ